MAAVSSGPATAPEPMVLPTAFTTFLSPLTLRLRDITSFQLPRLASSSSSTTSSSSAQTLFASHEEELLAALAECRQLVEQGEYLVEDLCQEVAFDHRGREKVQMMHGEWRRVREQFENATTASKAALLRGRKTLSELKEKGLLTTNDSVEHQQAGPTPGKAMAASSISSGRKPEGTLKRAGGDDESLLASQDLTSALHQTVSLLSDSLTQSAFSAELLAESSSTLSALSLDYTTFSDLLKNSGGILKSMERQDKIDALMLLAAYLFFALCVGYILKVRIWDRGVSFLAFFFRLFGLGSRARGEVEVENSLRMAGKVVQSFADSSSVTSMEAAEIATAITAAMAGGASSAFAALQKGKASMDDERGAEEALDAESQPSAVAKKTIHVEIEDDKGILEQMKGLFTPPQQDLQGDGAGEKTMDEVGEADDSHLEDSGENEGSEEDQHQQNEVDHTTETDPAVGGDDTGSQQGRSHDEL